MSAPQRHFKHCPACGGSLDSVEEKCVVCPACGFTYFFNPTIGLAGFIENDKEEILLIERGKDPAKGKLAPPGGFADTYESAEIALSREVLEETGLHVDNWIYVDSAVNQYLYKDVTYPVIDFFYTARVTGNPELSPCKDETNGARWFPIHSIDPAALAFPSMQTAFRKFLSTRQH